MELAASTRMKLRMFTAVIPRKRRNWGVEREVEKDQSRTVEDESLVAHTKKRLIKLNSLNFWTS